MARVRYTKISFKPGQVKAKINLISYTNLLMLHNQSRATH